MEFDHSTDTISPDDQTVLTIGGTGALVLPVGNTAQRTAVTNGSIRYNTDTVSLDFVVGGVYQVLRGSPSLAVTGISAAGTTQGTATAITSAVNNVTTVASGTGVVIPIPFGGDTIIIVNNGANILNVFPATGCSIDDGATNSAVTLAVARVLTLIAVTPTLWETASNTGSSGGAAAASNLLNARVASVANVTISSAPSTLDGSTLATNNLILLKNQTTSSENGLYQFNGTGSALTRASVLNTSVQAVPGLLLTVAEGTINNDSLWMLTTDGPITLGTTALTFKTQGGNTNLYDPGNNGVVVRTAQNTTTGRTLTGTTNQITLTNGDGIAGNPTFTLPSVLVAPGTLTVTGAFTPSTTTGISAAGSTQNTATAITADFNVVSTVSASTGVILPVATVGRRIYVSNTGANTLLVYPATGGQIDGLGTNTAVSLSVNQQIELYAISTTQWETLVNTGAAGGGGSGTVTSVTLTQPAAGLTLTNTSVSQTTAATSVFALADDLAAVEGLATTGIVRRTAANTWSAGTAVNLATEITDTLPAANGGTGINNSTRTLTIDTNAGTIAFTNAASTLTIANTASVSGTNTGDQTITLTGDVTGSGTTGITSTLATVNATVGSFGSGLVVPVITVNDKGLVTAVTTANVFGGITRATITVSAYTANEFSATVTDATATATSKVQCRLVINTLIDQNGPDELIDMNVYAIPSTGSIIFTLNKNRGWYVGPFYVDYFLA